MKKVGLLIGALIVCGILVGSYVWLHQPPRKNLTSAPAATQSAIDTKLKNMSLRDEVASLFVLHEPGVDPALLSKYMSTYHPGGFIVMGDNIPASEQALKQETAALRGSYKQFPYLVAVDQEGDTVRRLNNDTYPGAETLKDKPVSATSDAFKNRSQLVHDAGMTLNFGIIADTTADPSSFIYDRVLGTAPDASADRVAAAVKASHGLTLTTLKHFPGHGETEANSHTTIPTTDISYDQWLAHDAIPFQAGIKAGADVVMMGQLRYSSVDDQPATLSKKWHDILRQNLGFTGAIITDDMVMLQNSGDPRYRDPVHNAVSALAAGNTLLLYVLDNDDSATSKIDPAALIDGVTTAVKNGELDRSTVDQAAKQALQLRAKAARLMNS